MRPWLKEIRKKKGLTLKEAAVKCGISASYMDKIERGERDVSVRTAKQIADALDFRWSQFFE